MFHVDNSLDYPGVGPEHSFLKDMGRAEYYSVTDEEALEGTCTLSLYVCITCNKNLYCFFLTDLLRV